jgi:hypothetical protein
MIQFVCVRDLTGPIIHFEILYMMHDAEGRP